jgi:hypothetical protein
MASSPRLALEESPGVWHRGSMRLVQVLASVFLCACASGSQAAKKLADGSWTVTCSSEMNQCVRRAQEVCPQQRFRILEGVSETRLRDAPPYEEAYHTSRLRWICTKDGAEPLLSLDKEPARPSPDGVTRACTPGETRECVGSGACRGGQSCLTNGSGYGPCDCGPTVPPPMPAPSSPPTDASAAPEVPASPTP